MYHLKVAVRQEVDGFELSLSNSDLNWDRLYS